MLKDSTLMGMFSSTPSSIETTTVNMIYLFNYDPKGKNVVEKSCLSPHEAFYDAIQYVFNVPIDDVHLVALDPYHLPYWLEPLLPTLDYLWHTFPLDESIIEIMNTSTSIWEDHHHRSSFLPNTSAIDNDFVSLLGTNIVNDPQTPILLQDFEFEGNLYNITKMVPIDISVKYGTIEHVHIGQNYSIDETEEYKALFKEF